MSLSQAVTRSAAAALRIARKHGVQIKIAAPGASVWTTVYGFIVDNSQDTFGDMESMTLSIPVQTGIPPTGGFSTGHVVQYNSINYHVDSVTPDHGNYQSSASFALSCSRVVSGDCDIGEVPA